MRDFSGVVLFTDEAPVFELVDGLFHITQRFGEHEFRQVMRPAVYFQAIAEAVAVSREYRSGRSAEVLPFPVHAGISALGSPSK